MAKVIEGNMDHFALPDNNILVFRISANSSKDEKKVIAERVKRLMPSTANYIIVTDDIEVKVISNI